MGNKTHVTGDKMSVTQIINDPMFYGRTAKMMSEQLMTKYHRVGENYVNTADRIQQAHRVDASVVMQGWNREPRPMLSHRWFPLFHAWVEAGLTKVNGAYENEKSRHQDRSALVRLADLVDGSKDDGTSAA